MTPAKLNALVNPAKSPHSYWIGPAYTGASGTGSSTGTVTSASATWQIDGWADFYYVNAVSPTPHLITSNTTTALNTDDDLTDLTGSFTITSQTAIGTTDGMNVVRRIAGEVKSRLPEKYRRMLSKLDGEVAVDDALPYQSTATLTYQTTNANQMRVWRNLNGAWESRSSFGALLSPYDVSSGYATTQDYSVGTADPTVITFALGGNTGNSGKLQKGDTVVVEYDHNLSTVPKLLESITLYLSAYEILWQQVANADTIPQQIISLKERADLMLGDLHDGKIGIDEFDSIDMYVETRSDKSAGAPRIYAVRVDRG